MLTQTNSHEAFQFIGFLTEALPVIDRTVPTEINSGGCGIFAELLYHDLEDLGYKPEIVAILFTENCKQRKASLLKLIDGDPTVCKKTGVDHVLVKLDGMYLDSTGIV